MNIRKCKHCNKSFKPEGRGRTFILCRGCCFDCDTAYKDIADYVREHGRINTNELAEELNIPAIFITVLIQEGKFDSYKKTAEDAHICKSCGAELTDERQTMCEPCVKNFAQNAFSTKNTRPEVTAAIASAVRAKKPKPGKYGLGR